MLVGSLAIICFFSATAIFARTQSDNYVIWADVFSAGGQEGSGSTNYLLSDTISEAVIRSATTTATSYGIKEGFRELEPDQFLSFSLSTADLDLGILSTGSVTTGSHTMTVDTNATNGFSITVSGNSLTQGANVIDAIGGAEAASNPGSEQFGVNLVANAAPAVGANPSGVGTPLGAAANHYRIADQFAFGSGDTVATSTTDIVATTFTVSYITNIAAGTPSSNYQTTLTYSATANF